MTKELLTPVEEMGIDDFTHHVSSRDIEQEQVYASSDKQASIKWRELADRYEKKSNIHANVSEWLKQRQVQEVSYVLACFSAIASSEYVDSPLVDEYELD